LTVAAATRFWDAPDIAYSVSAANHAGHWSLDLTTPSFELNFVERHTVPPRADSFGIATIVEVDIMETAIVGFIPNRASAGANGTAFGFSVIVAVVAIIVVIAIPVVAARAVADRAIAILANPEMHAAIAAMKGDATSHGFVGLPMMRKGRSSEEQRRRKG
jgi:hypothetical protein